MLASKRIFYVFLYARLVCFASKAFVSSWKDFFIALGVTALLVGIGNALWCSLLC